MIEPFVRIAILKAASDVERKALEPIAMYAKELDSEESTFPSRINKNKALRGEAPTKLSQRKRKEIAGYATDAEEIEASQLVQFQDLATAASVIFCLKMALDSDVAFWSKNYAKANPADIPLIKQLLAAKTTCRDSMAAYLGEYYVDED